MMVNVVIFLVSWLVGFWITSKILDLVALLWRRHRR